MPSSTDMDGSMKWKAAYVAAASPSHFCSAVGNIEFLRGGPSPPSFPAPGSLLNSITCSEGRQRALAFKLVGGEDNEGTPLRATFKI